MAAEIERKFLLLEPPSWLGDHPSDEIAQGYLAVVEGEREVRLRRKGAQGLLTVKVGAGETRREEEIELSDEQFEALWPLTEGMRIFKTRHRVPHDGRTIEIDVYGKALSGMVVAEIEFDSERESHTFEPPEWLGPELTGDPRFANESLAIHGRPPEEEIP
jgi:adenylate cyclase